MQAQKEKNYSLPFFENTCELYDYSEAIDDLLFEEKGQQLVIIIADNMNQGIARAENLTKSIRIMPKLKREDLDYSKQFLYDLILDQFYLYTSLDINYFVYPMNMLSDILTIYWQKKLIKDYSYITFNFVNVNENVSSFEDIAIPLMPYLICTNCSLLDYVQKKLKKGESFAELLDLRKRLFSDAMKNHFFVINFNEIDMWSLLDRYSNFQNETSMVHVSMLLKKINNTSYTDRNSLQCFESRITTMGNFIFKRSSLDMSKMRNILILSDYLQSVSSNITSLSISEPFKYICSNVQMSELIRLFCFIKDLSDATVYNSTEWIKSLKQFANESLLNQKSWFKELILLYLNFSTLEKSQIVEGMKNLNTEMQKVEKNSKQLMEEAYYTVDLAIVRKRNKT